MAAKQYAAIASVVVAGKRYKPGEGFRADPDDEDVKRQVASQAMRCLDDLDEESAQPKPKPKRGRHERRDMRAQA